MALSLFYFVSGLLVGACLTCAQSARTATTTRSEKACRSLAQSLGSQTLFSGAQYNAAAKGAWNFFNQLDGEKVHDSAYGLVAHCSYIISEPTCIVSPRNTSDVIVAMKTIYESNSHYAVRGGGHSAMPGWNTYARVD
jgi:hypothetical protein